MYRHRMFFARSASIPNHKIPKSDLKRVRAVGDNFERDLKEISRSCNNILNAMVVAMVGQIILNVISDEGFTVMYLEKTMSLHKHVEKMLEQADSMNFKMWEIKRSCR